MYTEWAIGLKKRWQEHVLVLSGSMSSTGQDAVLRLCSRVLNAQMS